MTTELIDELLARSRPLILRLISGRVNPADGEDLAQDVSVRVWRYQLREPDLFWSLVGRGEEEYWLRTVTGRAVIDYRRRPMHREVAIDDYRQMISADWSPEDLVWERELLAIYRDWRARWMAKPPAATANAAAIRKTRAKQELQDEIRRGAHR